MSEAKATLDSKAKHYAHDEDRFHNFNVAARINNTHPITEAWGMGTKHLVAILDFIEDVKEGRPHADLPRLEEIFGDMRNYLFLIEGMTKEMLFSPDSPTV